MPQRKQRDGNSRFDPRTSLLQRDRRCRQPVVQTDVEDLPPVAPPLRRTSSRTGDGGAQNLETSGFAGLKYDPATTMKSIQRDRWFRSRTMVSLWIGCENYTSRRP